MNGTFRRFLVLAIVVVLILGALVLHNNRTTGIQTKTTLNVFGTLVEIIIRNTSRNTAEQAITAVTADFRKMHKDWHAWEPGELNKLNKAIAGGDGMKVSSFLLPRIVQAKRFHHLSDGLFNPAIGVLISKWGFHADLPKTGDIPAPETIRRLVLLDPSMDDLSIKDGHVSSSNKSVQLDLGGFAKGAALDLAAKRLESFGIKDAILNAGGDLNVLGNHGERRWYAGIRHPLHWGVIATVALDAGEGLYTSGNYERYREHEGVRFAHIIDPRTGIPVNHIVSASVIHSSGALADAAATALSIAGPVDWVRIARRMKIKYALLVDRDGTVYLTSQMKARVQFDGNPPAKIIIAPG